MLINNNDTKNRIIRLLIFMFLSFVLLRFVYDIDINTDKSLIIILSQTAIFMFIDVYYPSISIDCDKNNTNHL